jgi:hypothetical protein
VFSPGENLASENGRRAARTASSSSRRRPSAINLQLTRKVFVPQNPAFLRWLNVVTSTGPYPVSLSLALLGLRGSGTAIRITSTSTGDPGLSSQVQWSTTAQERPRAPSLGSRS